MRKAIIKKSWSSKIEIEAQKIEIQLIEILINRNFDG